MSSKRIAQKTSTPTPAEVRVIAGKWRNSKIRFVAEAGLRPTGDRIRETLFNWLSPSIQGSRCLDLFAGSGILGIEALSREAGSVVFVEQSRQAASNIHQNLQRLDAGSRFSVNCEDATRWLEHAVDTFDIVFLDPPFALDMVDSCCELLETNALLKQDALVYIELPSRLDAPAVPAHWQLLREKRAGEVCYRLYQRNSFEVSGQIH